MASRYYCIRRKRFLPDLKLYNNMKIKIGIAVLILIVITLLAVYFWPKPEEVKKDEDILIETEELNISEELRDCLPKSDMASKEKCDRILQAIQSFDDCVSAGFSIIKTNPPQCVTPDGRKFIETTNSWEEVKETIATCQTEKAFQTHARFVSVTLKDGRRLTAMEPVIDDIINEAEAAASRCGKIMIGTE